MEDETKVVTVLREIGRGILEDRYGVLQPISGQGVQAGTRFSLTDGGNRRTCAVKVVTKDHNRIHFPRADGDGGWTTLRDVDLILYVRRLPGRTDHYEAQMYSQATLLAAFDENRAHAVATGITHLPVWLSPEKEKGDRFVGSGFGHKALWKATGRIKAIEQAVVDEPAQPLTIQQAKRGIAAFLQISPDAIEITIRA